MGERKTKRSYRDCGEEERKRKIEGRKKRFIDFYLKYYSGKPIGKLSVPNIMGSEVAGDFVYLHYHLGGRKGRGEYRDELLNEIKRKYPKKKYR